MASAAFDLPDDRRRRPAGLPAARLPRTSYWSVLGKLAPGTCDGR